MHISSVQTNFSGRLPYIRKVSINEWSDKYFKPVKALLETLRIYEARTRICEMALQLKTNDEHIHRCFIENFPKADPLGKPELFLYAINGIEDVSFLKIFHDAENLSGFSDKISKMLTMREYEDGLNDEELRQFNRLPKNKRDIVALKIPSGMYVSDLNLFFLLNTNSYQVFRDSGIFSSLKKLSLSKTSIDKNGNLKNTSNLSFIINAASIIPSVKSCSDSIAFISADSGMKDILSVSMVENIPETAFLASSQIVINIDSMKISTIEQKPFVSGKAIAENASVLESARNFEFENVKIESETIKKLSFFSEIDENEKPSFGDSNNSLKNSLMKRNTFGMFDPVKCWGKEKVASSGALKYIIIIKKDYDYRNIMRYVSVDESIKIMNSPENFVVYDESSLWESELNKLYSVTVPWFDTDYMSLNENDREKQDVLMKKIIEKGVRLVLLNPIIPVNQLPVLIHKILNESVEFIDIAEEPSPVLCAKLRIRIKGEEKDGKKIIRYVTSDGTEVNIISFRCKNNPTYYAAFDKNPMNRNFVKSFSRGSVSDFFCYKNEAHTLKVV